jgi:CheY-like chemotaxis protein
VRPGGTLLLVEDDEGVRRLASRVLGEAGYEVLSAGTPEEALRLVAGEEHALDLMVTDLVLPGMSGFDLADRVLEMRPDLSVLYTSGYADADLRAEGRLLERGRFLEKPFTPEELVAAVGQAILRTRTE